MPRSNLRRDNKDIRKLCASAPLFTSVARRLFRALHRARTDRPNFIHPAQAPAGRSGQPGSKFHPQTGLKPQTDCHPPDEWGENSSSINASSGIGSALKACPLLSSPQAKCLSPFSIPVFQPLAPLKGCLSPTPCRDRWELNVCPLQPARAKCLSPFSNGRADDEFLFPPGHPKCFRTLLVYRS